MKTYQKIAIAVAAGVCAAVWAIVLLTATARAADAPSVKQIVVVPSIEESRFILSKPVKFEDKDGDPVMAILVIGDFEDLESCLVHLDAILKSSMSDDHKLGFSCVKITKVVDVIKGSSL